MSRRGKPRRLKGSQASGHSSLANGWFIPSGATVEKVELKAREVWAKIAGPADMTESDAARLMGRVEGMAIALAILKQGPDGQVLKASDELRRIKHGKPGSPADRAGN
ncbi:hypothetical protein SEA_AMOK_65 [Gordonia phage Amok]|nr:hypothetical protein SEA_AMOK_65 [Gordonia phage Amok]